MLKKIRNFETEIRKLEAQETVVMNLMAEGKYDKIDKGLANQYTEGINDQKDVKTKLARDYTSMQNPTVKNALKNLEASEQTLNKLQARKPLDEAKREIEYKTRVAELAKDRTQKEHVRNQINTIDFLPEEKQKYTTRLIEVQSSQGALKKASVPFSLDDISEAQKGQLDVIKKEQEAIIANLKRDNTLASEKAGNFYKAELNMEKSVNEYERLINKGQREAANTKLYWKIADDLKYNLMNTENTFNELAVLMDMWNTVVKKEIVGFISQQKRFIRSGDVNARIEQGTGKLLLTPNQRNRLGEAAQSTLKAIYLYSSIYRLADENQQSAKEVLEYKTKIDLVNTPNGLTTLRLELKEFMAAAKIAYKAEALEKKDNVEVVDALPEVGNFDDAGFRAKIIAFKKKRDEIKKRGLSKRR
jgi:hypothetical protein